MHVHLIDGEKGGVGKSWLARLMLQFFIDAGDPKGVSKYQTADPFKGVECDESNPTLKRIYGKEGTSSIVSVTFSDDPRFEDSPNILFDLSITHNLVVNLAANSYSPVSKWIKKKGLLTIGKSYGIQFVKWFLSDGEDDSINAFLKSLREFGKDIPHVFVKNMGRCEEWNYFDNHPEVKKVKAPGEGHIPFAEMVLPRMSDLRRVTINSQKLTFGEARTRTDILGILSTHQNLMYLEEAYEAIRNTELDGVELAPLDLVEKSAVVQPAINAALAPVEEEASVAAEAVEDSIDLIEGNDDDFADELPVTPASISEPTEAIAPASESEKPAQSHRVPSSHRSRSGRNKKAASSQTPTAPAAPAETLPAAAAEPVQEPVSVS